MSAGMSVEQRERVERWTRALRNTHLPQSQNRLFGSAENDGDTVIASACCLGICILEFEGWERSHSFIGQAMSGLVPTLLGLPDFGHSTGNPGDVYLDWPEGMRPIVEVGLFGPGSVPREWPGVAASWLNDFGHCTFSQIADLVDYFGLVVES